MSDFTIDPNKLDGYPSFADMNGFSSAQESPRPRILMTLNSTKLQGYPSYSYISGFSPTQESPYPKSLLTCTDGILDGYPAFAYYGNFNSAQESPYPRCLMSCENDYLKGYPSFRINFETFGAFKNIPTLKVVVIPKSVTRISDYAFWNTSITEVTINKECIYGEHTFPEGCTIKFYDD